MKCPYRVDEVKNYFHDGKTWTYEEFADCYKDNCPFWGVIKHPIEGIVYGCRKVEKDC